MSSAEAGNTDAGGKVQLRLRLGTGVRLTGIYGCQADSRDEGQCSFLVSSCWRGSSRQAVFRFEFSPRPSGLHQVILAEWTCIHESGEWMLTPGSALSLQFSHHTSAAQPVMDSKVEKHLKFLQNPDIVGRALKSFEKGNFLKGEELLRRRADEMLIYAARQTDLDFLKEAEMLYSLGSHFRETFLSTA